MYTINTGSDSISSISLKNGAELVESVATTLNAPIDMTISQDGLYLYVLSSGHMHGSGQLCTYVYGMECDCGSREVQAITNGLGNKETREVKDGNVNGVVVLVFYSS